MQKNAEECRIAERVNQRSAAVGNRGRAGSARTGQVGLVADGVRPALPRPSTRSSAQRVQNVGLAQQTQPLSGGEEVANGEWYWGLRQWRTNAATPVSLLGVVLRHRRWHTRDVPARCPRKW